MVVLGGASPTAVPMPGRLQGLLLDAVHELVSWASILLHLNEATRAPAGEAASVVQSQADGAARFQRMMLPHLDAAHNLARFLSGDAGAAEDIVQNAYLKAFRGFGDFRGGNAKSWILAIVRNCHLDWRSEQRRRNIIEPLELMPGPDDPANDASERPDLPHEEITPETILLERMEADEVRLVLASLPDVFREALVLRELESLSYREIADIASIPLGTVMSRLARARALFAAAWQQRLAAGSPGS
jgi:RNA polymerase sigma-70 factor (ECF subfamily)